MDLSDAEKTVLDFLARALETSGKYSPFRASEIAGETGLSMGEVESAINSLRHLYYIEPFVAGKYRITEDGYAAYRGGDSIRVDVNVTVAVDVLIRAIDALPVSDLEKKTMKDKLREYSRHPAFIAALTEGLKALIKGAL